MIARWLGVAAAGLLGLGVALAWVLTALDARNAPAHALPSLLEGLGHVRQQAVNRDVLNAQRRELEAMLGDVSDRLPSKLVADEVERDARELAAAAGVELLLADARGEQVKEFYAVLPLQLRVRGPNDAVYGFLAQLANGASLRHVDALRIAPADEARETLAADVMLELYRYRDDGELDHEHAR